MAVFVTDGDQRATLAVVRSLGRAGVRVVVGHSRRHSLAGASKYCSRTVCYPSPWQHPLEFQAFLLEELRNEDYQVLLPMTDVTAVLAVGLRKRLPARICLPLGDEVALQRAQDKAEVLRIAQELGISVPQCFQPAADEPLEHFARRLPYPVVIKPRFSRELRGNRWVAGPVSFAHTPEELQTRYAEVAARAASPLVQEKIEGQGRGVFLLVWGNELKAAFCHRRLREKPPWGGVSVLRESLPFDHTLVAKSFALLRALGWDGPAMVEYKQDGRDGTLKLMEVNARFWGSLQLAVDAGLDFPYLLYRLAAGENVAPQLSYTPHVRSRWLLGDLDYLMTVVRHQERVRRLAPAEASRLRACVNFLKFYQPRTKNEIWHWDDLAPAWFELKTYVRDLLVRSPAARFQPKPTTLAAGGSS